MAPIIDFGRQSFLMQDEMTWYPNRSSWKYLCKQYLKLRKIQVSYSKSGDGHVFLIFAQLYSMSSWRQKKISPTSFEESEGMMGGRDRKNEVGAQSLACTLRRIRIRNSIILNISFLTHFATIVFWHSRHFLILSLTQNDN
jgi:hypothetical protein